MRFCPRIRSLHRQRIYPDRDHGVLVPVLQRDRPAVNFRLIAEQWNRIGQLPANGFLVVLRNAPAVGVHEAEAELRGGGALRGGAAQPLMLHLSAADSIAGGGLAREGGGNLVAQESVREFQVVTSGYAAEAGRSGGAP